MAPKICSLHIGVAYADQNHYNNYLVPLPCCTTDARIMHKLTQLFNYDETRILLNEMATTTNVKAAILEYSKVLKKNDVLIITYSGHGSKIEDLNFDEPQDQTWCLYDRQLIDDELPHLWKEFRVGVNVFLLLDSCHSGTAYKNLLGTQSKYINPYQFKVKNLEKQYYGPIYEANKHLYTPILRVKNVKEADIKCSLLTFSACQDDEEALTKGSVSYFTRLIINHLALAGNKIKNYNGLFREVSKKSFKEEKVRPKKELYGKGTTYFDRAKPLLKVGDSYPKDLQDALVDILIDSMTDIPVDDKGLIVDTTEAMKTKLKQLSNSNNVDLLFKRDDPEQSKTKSFFSYLVQDDSSRKTILHPWDRAYDYYDRLKINGVAAFVEPDISYKLPKDAPNETGEGKYLRNWPSPEGEKNEFSWHLDENFSQLADARDWIEQNIDKNERKIKIAIIDTGVTNKNHPGLPKNILKGVSFVPGEKGQPAVDKLKTGKIGEQDFHGTATATLLAGKELDDTIAYGRGSRKIGAIPFATIYPIRISDTVALIFLLRNTIPFVKAVRAAIKQGCEVISMSMGGIPGRLWAKVVNEAYRKGVTLISASGNSWTKGLFAKMAPKKILYPARFDRVISVSGVCYNQEPYVFKGNSYDPMTKMVDGETMQGNVLPYSAMKSTIAAYTPNIAWAQYDSKGKPIFRKSGGGTSAATPQVAAAAALWIVKHRKELDKKGYTGTWRQVESVRNALFKSADKSFPLYKKYYGNGILKAKNALEIGVQSKSQLRKSRWALLSPLGLLEFIKVVVVRKSAAMPPEKYDKVKAEMIIQEIVQVLEIDPILSRIYNELDLFDEDNPVSKDQFNNIFEKVKLSPYSSQYLKSLPKL